VNGVAGVLAPQRSQVVAVVGAVLDADAVVVDLAPLDRQQFQVVLTGQGQRQVPGRGDQRGVLLVRRQHPPRLVRVSQALMGGRDPPTLDIRIWPGCGRTTS
jgi:hypothetical protein